MSEKEEGNQEKEKGEEVILHHFYHKHPLTLTQAESRYDQQCYGCRRYIFSGETAYTCREKCSYLILHEECAEMPREITLSMHPQHALVQKQASYTHACAVCEEGIRRIGYYCSSSDSCGFQIHVGCARSTDIIHAAAGERSCRKHDSHPQHELTMLWRPGQAASLRCDACGTLQRGNSYICIVCQYVIHESCADLPATFKYHNHAHSLSLAYHLPQEYINFNFKCDVCFKDLIPKNWLYHCTICRHIVHIKCATRTSPSIMSNTTDAKDVITFPIKNAVGDLIEGFVRKLGGMVNIPDEEEMVKGKYKFHNPNHQLRLISSSSSLHDQVERIKNCDDDDEDADDDDDDDDEEFYYEKLSKLVCDGCTEPILLEKSSCSNNNRNRNKYSYSYVSCEECKFFLHLACFQLPDEVASSHTNCHQEPDHILTLQTTPKLNFSFCGSCYTYTNGLCYRCTKCSFKADIKCVSLPETIKHAAHDHPNHHLNLLTEKVTREGSYWQRLCGACGLDTAYEVCYRCETCGIIFHSRCCLLPPQISNRRYDKHPLWLTFDAAVNHPGEFYCDVCEQKMNPKSWMYHCRDCDVSVHPNCFPNVSDRYLNIKFGGRYLFGAAAPRHPHPLTFQPLTNSRKSRCDVCSHRMEYGTRGFQCCSDECDFFVCHDWCYENGRRAFEAID